MTYVTDQDKKQIHKKYAQFKLQEEFRLTKQNSRIGQDKNIITPYFCEKMCYQLSNDHMKSRVHSCFHIQKHPGKIPMPVQKVPFGQSQK